MKSEPDEKTFAGDARSTSRAAERHPALVFLRGELLAAPIPLEREEGTLGRALDPSTGEARYRLTDLGSTNGTLLNGRPVKDAYLQEGDKLTVGEHIMRFELLDDIDREYQRQIHRLLAHHELTGLLTSKSFFPGLRRESARAEAEALPFCVLMMDLDHFKAVNDTHGHLVGSQTIEEVGALITRALRAGDVAARFGGEEFAPFLLHADCAQGLVAAERVRSSIESNLFSAVRRGAANDTGETLRLTISIGVASYPDDARDPIELVELADTALYRAKNMGRNRVVAYCVSPPDLKPGDKTTSSPR